MAEPRKKRKKPYDACSRALKDLREQGWLADKVERKNQFIARDWCGFADIIAVRPWQTEAIAVPEHDGGTGFYFHPVEVLLLQVTSSSNMSSHRAKILANPEAKRAHDMGCEVRLWGYKKVGARWVLHQDEEPFNAV